MQNMQSPKNSMIIIRQCTLYEIRKRKGSRKIWTGLKIQTLIANHRWQLGGRKKSADTWINLHWKTSSARLLEENAQGTRTTGSCLSTPRDLSHSWTKRDDYLEAVKTIKDLRQADQPSHPPILSSNQTRQRPFQERHRAERDNSKLVKSTFIFILVRVAQVFQAHIAAFLVLSL